MSLNFLKMSEDRKKVSTDQLRILIEELEADRSLLSGREGRGKLEHSAKWELLAKKLNSTENGALKSVTKWQQSLRDWKNNTKKKATKLGANRTTSGDSGQELSSLEGRLLALYNDEIPPVRTVTIDISKLIEVDPLSSDDSDQESQYPAFTTYSCDTPNDNSRPAEQTEDHKCKVNRRRVQVVPEDLIRNQNSLLDRLTSLEASRREAENRQNCLLEALAGAVERHAAATEQLARAAEAQARLMGTIAGLLEKQRDT